MPTCAAAANSCWSRVRSPSRSAVRLDGESPSPGALRNSSDGPSSAYRSQDLGLRLGLSRRDRLADADIGEAELPHQLGPVDVAQVDQDGIAHHAPHALEVERPEGIPFGHDHQRVGPVGAGIGDRRRRSHRRPAGASPAPCPRDRRPGLGAAVLQPGDDRERGRLAHVVGVRLEGQAEHGDGLAAHAAAAGLDHLARHRPLALVVDGRDRLDDADRRVVVLRRLDQRERVLREAGAAIAGSGVQELRADAVVEADAARDLLDVRADLLAEIGDLVDEGDLRREEGVRGVFGELGRAARGEQERRLVEVERAVELGHDRLRRARPRCR